MHTQAERQEFKRLLFTLMRPFFLAQRDGYAALGKIKYLETFVGMLLERLIPLAPEWQRPVLNSLPAVIKGFDEADLEEKKQKIEKAFSLFEKIRQPSPQWEVLFTALEKIPLFTKRWQRVFKKKGMCFLEDVLYFLPNRYEDFRHIKHIREVKPGETALVKGKIVASGILPVKQGRKRLYKVVISDGTGYLAGIWFNYQLSYMQTEFKRQREVVFFGEVKGYTGEKVMHHPEVKWNVEEFKPAIVPVYPELSGLYPKQVRNFMQKVAARYAHYLGNPLPAFLQRRYKLPALWEAVYYLHLPPIDTSIQALNQRESAYHHTLKFLELFALELGLAIRRKAYLQRKGIAFSPDGHLVKPFLKSLPFELTQAQKRVLKEIKKDMTSPRPMHRLLQGDVGSGKTVVALIAALMAIESGYQVAIMAPTEILAQQHFTTAQRWLSDLPIKTALLTSHLKPKEKEELQAAIAQGEYQLVVGTHALIQERVAFKNLGLVVIDEQHRFGVAQRAELIEKGITPDVLVMTATPIPRTLAMTLYGDLDISIIDEMPPGRRPIKTMHFWERQREEVYAFLEKMLKEGAQVYVVYPLIEESEALDLKAATTMYEALKERFSDYKVALLHGRMKAEGKQNVMEAFRRGEVQILVSTTVIEVGVDVPQAKVMVIEHAERFGLAQLHQLRGRVGRRSEQAYCLLLTPEKITSLARERLRVMVETTDGFKIAEADLRLRGPGEILGTKQAGFPEFRFADLACDINILKQAREAAMELIQNDPFLKRPEHRALREYLKHYWGEKLRLSLVG